MNYFKVISRYFSMYLLKKRTFSDKTIITLKKFYISYAIVKRDIKYTP